jgi:hypothetical protein
MYILCPIPTRTARFRPLNDDGCGRNAQSLRAAGYRPPPHCQQCLPLLRFDAASSLTRSSVADRTLKPWIGQRDAAWVRRAWLRVHRGRRLFATCISSSRIPLRLSQTIPAAGRATTGGPDSDPCATTAAGCVDGDGRLLAEIDVLVPEKSVIVLMADHVSTGECMVGHGKTVPRRYAPASLPRCAPRQISVEIVS